MPIQFKCPNCARSMRVPDGSAGRRGKCPACGAAIVVPADADADTGYDLDVEGPSGHDAAADAAADAAIAAFAASGTAVAPPPPLVGQMPPPTFRPPPLVTGDPDDTTKDDAKGRDGFYPMPREPWFYGLISAMASLLAILGVLQFVLVTISVLLMAYTDTRPSDPDAAGRGLLWLWSLGMFVGSLITAAPIFLGVDVARNIRAIRYGPR